MTLSASALSNEALVASRFHGIEPSSTLQQEQPYHRHAAYLFACGADTREVADALGVTQHAVRSWLREPWFQQRCSQIMAEHGGRDLTQLFINEAFATAATLFELRDKTKSDMVKLNVCREILDRGFGKPKVFVETSKAPAIADPVEEVARLEKENAKLREQGPN